MDIDDYLNDCKVFIRLASAHIKAEMSPVDAAQATLLFAVGVEKLLKYMLGRLNTVFILNSPDFKHSAPTLFPSKILPGAGKEIEPKPDKDVISFRTSLGRLKTLSEATNKHSQLLFKLSQNRDIVAHRPSSELNLESAVKLLSRDAVVLIRDLCAEQGLSPSDFFGNDIDRLTQLSDHLIQQDDFEQSMVALLDNHKQLWQHRKNHQGFIAQATEITESLIRQSAKENTFSYEVVPCPACGQRCVVRIEPDYDHADGQAYISGVYAEILQCYFCSLKLDRYDQLDYVDVDRLLADMNSV